MIKVFDVTKSFGDFKALSSVSMNVKKGSVYGLIGPKGKRKTTIIKNLIGVYMYKIIENNQLIKKDNSKKNPWKTKMKKEVKVVESYCLKRIVVL